MCIPSYRAVSGGKSTKDDKWDCNHSNEKEDCWDKVGGVS
jgi:hypothetical protein